MSASPQTLASLGEETLYTIPYEGTHTLPPLGISADAAEDRKTASEVTLKEVIGSGGMGVVHLASRRRNSQMQSSIGANMTAVTENRIWASSKPAVPTGLVTTTAKSAESPVATMAINVHGRRAVLSVGSAMAGIVLHRGLAAHYGQPAFEIILIEMLIIGIATVNSAPSLRSGPFIAAVALCCIPFSMVVPAGITAAGLLMCIVMGGALLYEWVIVDRFRGPPSNL